MAKAGRPMGRLHQDDVRAKIQASHLINILHKCANGVEELKPDRMKAIEILLRKSLPDLSAVEISGNDDNPLTMLTKVEFAVVKPTN
jgi:hypothetical protein